MVRQSAAKVSMKAFAGYVEREFFDLVVPRYGLANLCRRILIPIVLSTVSMRTAPSCSIFRISSRRFTPPQPRSVDERLGSLRKTNPCKDRGGVLSNSQVNFLA